MSVHVGEVRSEVDVQGGAPAAGGGDGGQGQGGEAMGWAAHEKHRRLAAAAERMRCRIAGDGFDG